MKILYKIWKNLIFLPLISSFMTYHSKIHIKDTKFNQKLSRPNFRPFWTPVSFLKLMKPDLYNFFESSFWTVLWCSFLVYLKIFVKIWIFIFLYTINVGYYSTYEVYCPTFVLYYTTIVVSISDEIGPIFKYPYTV